MAVGETSGQNQAKSRLQQPGCWVLRKEHHPSTGSRRFMSPRWGLWNRAQLRRAANRPLLTRFRSLREEPEPPWSRKRKRSRLTDGGELAPGPWVLSTQSRMHERTPIYGLVRRIQTTTISSACHLQSPSDALHKARRIDTKLNRLARSLTSTFTNLCAYAPVARFSSSARLLT